MLFHLAWRNIWRNPRRTVVILTAVVIGVWAMIFLGALMRGIADRMVRNGIATLTGHIQIRQRDYRSDPVVENRLTDPFRIYDILSRRLPSESHWTPRVRVSAVASNARHSGGLTLVGIDPLKEARTSFIGRAVSDGRYLGPDDLQGILVGEALVEKYETRLGHKLVLMSQNAAGEIASRAFRIVGIFRAEMEATEKQFVFITLPAAQQMLGIADDISEISILLADRTSVDRTAESLRAAVPVQDVVVQTWQELLPLVTAVLKMYDGFIYIWFLTVFIAMGFGLVNTILMAVFERIREFGLLRSLGMKPLWVIGEVLAESFYLIVIGMTVGNILGLLSVWSLSGSGIDLSAFAAGLEFVGMSRVIIPVVQLQDVVVANITVAVLGLLISLYPALKAARFSPVEAMAHT